MPALPGLCTRGTGWFASRGTRSSSLGTRLPGTREGFVNKILFWNPAPLFRGSACSTNTDNLVLGLLEGGKPADTCSTWKHSLEQKYLLLLCLVKQPGPGRGDGGGKWGRTQDGCITGCARGAGVPYPHHHAAVLALFPPMSILRPPWTELLPWQTVSSSERGLRCPFPKPPGFSRVPKTRATRSQQSSSHLLGCHFSM